MTAHKNLSYSVVVMVTLVVPSLAYGHPSQDRKIKELERALKELVARVDLLEKARQGETVSQQAEPGGALAQARCGALENGRPSISSTIVQQILADVDRLKALLRFAPVMQDGKLVGYRLQGMAPDSLAKSCGFQEGDVILRLNQFRIETPDGLKRAIERGKAFPEWHFEIQRGSQVIMNSLIETD